MQLGFEKKQQSLSKQKVKPANLFFENSACLYRHQRIIEAILKSFYYSKWKSHRFEKKKKCFCFNMQAKKTKNTNTHTHTHTQKEKKNPQM